LQISAPVSFSNIPPVHELCRWNNILGSAGSIQPGGLDLNLQSISTVFFAGDVAGEIPSPVEKYTRLLRRHLTLGAMVLEGSRRPVCCEPASPPDPTFEYLRFPIGAAVPAPLALPSDVRSQVTRVSTRVQFRPSFRKRAPPFEYRI
jgi:hypothetical protein